MCGSSFFPDFKLNDGCSILIHYKTCPEGIIVNLSYDNYHPDNSVWRVYLSKFGHT